MWVVEFLTLRMTLVIIYDAKYIEIKTSKKLARKMNKTIFLD